jgi:hypothetical protein
LSISTNGGANFSNKTSASNGLGDNTIRGVYIVGSTIYAATVGGLSFCTATTTLPVSGIELNGTATDKQIKLNFKAINEREMGSYTIERSTDGSSFTNIGSLQASNVNQAIASYSFADNQPIIGNNYYRIKGNSINGQIQFSNVVVVKYGVNVASVSIVPNPIEGKIVKLKLSQLSKGNYNISITDAFGRTILKKEMLLDGSGTVQLNLPSSVSAGNYFVKVMGQEGIRVQKFVF